MVPPLGQAFTYGWLILTLGLTGEDFELKERGVTCLTSLS
jgi:hypothetical protein